MGLAGWLFADLLLGLSLVFLASGSLGGGRDAGAKSQANTTTTTLSAAQQGLDRDPIILIIRQADAKSAEALAREVGDAVANQLAFRGKAGHKIGFALVFGGSTSPSAGVETARATVGKLQFGLADLIGTAATREYWSGELASGDAKLELFVLN